MFNHVYYSGFVVLFQHDHCSTRTLALHCVYELYIHVLTRRIRELNENNTKKFIEERKRQAVLQSRQIELLKKLHVEQSEILAKDSLRVSRLYSP